MAVVIGFVVLIGGGLLALFLIRSGFMFVSITHVPDGEEWQRFYRRRLAEKRTRRPGPMVWIVLGLGVGFAVVGVVLYFVAS